MGGSYGSPNFFLKYGDYYAGESSQKKHKEKEDEEKSVS